MKAVEYPLAALTLLEEECNQIMAPIKKATLAKTSINRNYPKVLLYRQKQEGGLGMYDLFLIQGITHVQKFHQYHGTGSITDKLNTVSLEICILEIRIGRNIFELDYYTFSGLATNSWVKGDM